MPETVPLTVTTIRVPASDDLLPFTSAEHPLVWTRAGATLVGSADTVVQLRASGPDRVADLAAQWRELSAQADITSELDLPGTGLVAFGAIAFAADSSATSTLTVPRHILGRSGDDTWLTTIEVRTGATSPLTRSAPPATHGYGHRWNATLTPGAVSAERYRHNVEAGLESIAAGEVQKLVLARDLTAPVPEGADLRRLVSSLADSYPDCWTFAIDGLIGASPETLITVNERVVTARVLAGTAARGADSTVDAQAALDLVRSSKDQDEHQYAVQSVKASLAPHTTALAASEAPFTLKLPNVWHLATDVEGTLADHASSLDLVAALHPTAAVAGTPTITALAAISRIEGMDRGRYAGPVGWIDADGNGEWAIALRCVQVSEGPERTFTAHAGAGIVAGSDPERELRETQVKFRPIVDAISSVG